MPITEFLCRLVSLHDDETVEERNASLRRYQESQQLSPQTRMETAGTSVDPVYFYGAIRVVGQWRWEQKVMAYEAREEEEEPPKRDWLEDLDDDEFAWVEKVDEPMDVEEQKLEEDCLLALEDEEFTWVRWKGRRTQAA